MKAVHSTPSAADPGPGQRLLAAPSPGGEWVSWDLSECSVLTTSSGFHIFIRHTSSQSYLSKAFHPLFYHGYLINLKAFYSAFWTQVLSQTHILQNFVILYVLPFFLNSVF